MHPVQLVDQAPGHRPSSQPRAAGSVGAHQRSWERTEVAFLLPFVAEVAVQVPVERCFLERALRVFPSDAHSNNREKPGSGFNLFLCGLRAAVCLLALEKQGVVAPGSCPNFGRHGGSLFFSIVIFRDETVYKGCFLSVSMNRSCCVFLLFSRCVFFNKLSVPKRNKTKILNAKS